MKPHLLAAAVLLTLATSLFATSYAPISLPDLIKSSEYIFAGNVVNVRMTDKNGKEVTDPEARTGPGLENTIYLDVVVDHSLILKSHNSKIPKEISIPLDQMRHLPLGESQKFFKEKTFFFLDKEFHPTHPGNFQAPLEDQKKLESIIRRVGKK
jgi:hypothetical protein